MSRVRGPNTPARLVCRVRDRSWTDRGCCHHRFPRTCHQAGGMSGGQQEHSSGSPPLRHSVRMDNPPSGMPAHIVHRLSTRYLRRRRSMSPLPGYTPLHRRGSRPGSRRLRPGRPDPQDKAHRSNRSFRCRRCEDRTGIRPQGRTDRVHMPPDSPDRRRNDRLRSAPRERTALRGSRNEADHPRCSQGHTDIGLPRNARDPEAIDNPRPGSHKRRPYRAPAADTGNCRRRHNRDRRRIPRRRIGHLLGKPPARVHRPAGHPLRHRRRQCRALRAGTGPGTRNRARHRHADTRPRGSCNLR